MKRYQQPSGVSTVAALGAALATVATIGVAVLLPAKLAPMDAPVVAAQRAPAGIAVIPSIEVIGYRTQATAVSDPDLETRQARESTGGSKS